MLKVEFTLFQMVMACFFPEEYYILKSVSQTGLLYYGNCFTEERRHEMMNGFVDLLTGKRQKRGKRL